MPIEKIHLTGAHSRAEEMYRLLRDQILEGTLKPYDRLVESELASLASISRTPVREAIRKLEVAGLVQNTGQGMVVSGISRQELTDVCAVRETLEGMAAGMAAGSRSELELLTLQTVATEYRTVAATKNVRQLVNLNHSFHERIWHLAGNRYLAEQLGSLRSMIERRQATTLGIASRLKQSVEEHEELVGLIEKRMQAEATELARLHFREAMAIRLSMLDGSQEAVL